jgi:UDP-N-acetylglucosamine transferase subunit ALG13
VIFVTVGGQLPFDRLILKVDQWASTRRRGDLFAQIGVGGYVPTAFPHCAFLQPEEFRARALAASAIVAHAGIGAISLALEAGKPLLIVPRLHALGEHRNDHQLHTAQRFETLGKIRVVYDADLLSLALDELEAAPPVGFAEGAQREQLVSRIRACLEAPRPAGPVRSALARFTRGRWA